MKRSLSVAIIAAALALGIARGFSDDAPPAEPKWTGSAAAGLTLTRGNSETLLGTIKVDATKKWTANELMLGADAAYGENKTTAGNTEKSAESAHGFTQYNRLFNERFYGYARIDLLHDAVADIEYRLSFSPGVGYYFIKEKNVDLSGEVGPGVVAEKLGGAQKSYFTLRVAEKFNWHLNDHARVWQMAELLPQVDRLENYIINAELGIESGLTKAIALRSFIQDTYNNEPAPGRKSNDLKWVTAIAYKF